MNKTLRNSLIVILILIILFALIWLIYDSFKKEPANANITNENLLDENTGLDNLINDLFENVEVNETNNQIKQDENKQNTNQEQTNNNTNQKNEQKNTETTNESVTSKEEKAVNLVKKTWGDSQGVYFSNMGIDNQGRYIVSVNDSGSTKTLAFYIVDVDKELVTKQ